MPQKFDFVIVGGGTSGCLLASRLSHARSAPSVLLLETGDSPSGDFLHAPFHRFHAVALRPDLDHGYTSEPEAQLHNRSIGYQRGKGLGGSSVLNFAVYLRGSREDYDRWGTLVGDEDWEWKSVKESFKRIESYDGEGSKGYKQFAEPGLHEHGTEGGLCVGLPPVLEEGVLPQMEALAQLGESINQDVNDGDPMGVSVFPQSYGKGGRSTSAAFLLDPPPNLEVWTGAKVEKLVWEGARVVGVVTEGGREVSANKEVVICGGAIDSPKLLLLNGIGPKAELEALGIESKVDLPGVGKQLHDHILTFMTVEVAGSINKRYAFESNEALVAEAQAAWKIDQSGAFSLHHSGLWGGFLKLPGLEQTREYKSLAPELQAFLAKPTVPHYEFINNALLWPPGTQLQEGNTYMTFLALLMSPQSRGSVTLRSPSPAEKPVIKLNYLTQPYDRVAMREAIRETWKKVTLNPVVAPHIVRTLLGPASLSDEHVDEFMKEQASTVWHAGGTCVMGKKGDKGAVVDKDCRVIGIEGLRVADMSVVPVSTNNHTQATAYLVGQKVAEKLVREYGL